MEKRHVLVIESDWRMRKLIRANLGAIGFEVQEAVNGQHGLQQLSGECPDLILLDLDMPDMDVLRLLDAIHSRLITQPAPIIVMSADPPDRRLMHSGHGARHLQKPFSVSALLWQVQQALGHTPPDE